MLLMIALPSCRAVDGTLLSARSVDAAVGEQAELDFTMRQANCSRQRTRQFRRPANRKHVNDADNFWFDVSRYVRTRTLSRLVSGMRKFIP
jgi:hypothetical protein